MFLPVKSLLRFRCVSKSWKNLISESDQAFSRSATRNLLFTLISQHITDLTPGDSSDDSDDVPGVDYSVVPYSMRHLIENPSFSFSIDPYYHLDNKDCSGTCNGLICLSNYSVTDAYRECTGFVYGTHQPGQHLRYLVVFKIFATLHLKLSAIMAISTSSLVVKIQLTLIRWWCPVTIHINREAL